MFRIELQKLELIQFQKFDYFVAEFSPTITNVTGDNGTGKTTLYTAIMWLMFGKDAYGRKDFDIRRNVGGIDYESDTEVIGTFRIITDNSTRTMKLRRVIHGAQDSKGIWHDTTLCYIDDVPKLISEYEQYIDDLIPEDEFKMLTSINYFLSLDTAEQRKFLCKMAGTRDIADVIEGNYEMEMAYDKKPKDMSLEDFIKSTKDSLKQYKDDKKTIQPSINALIQSKPEEMNWDALSTQKQAIEAEIKTINEQLTSLEDAVKIKVGERTKVYEAMEQAKAELKALQDAENAEINNLTDNTNKAYEETKAKQKDITDKLSKAEKEYNEAEAEVKSLEAKITRLDAEMNELLGKYNAENNIEFNVCCPLIEGLICNEIQGVAKEEMKKTFTTNKQKKLEAILAEGKAKKTEYDRAKEQLAKDKTSLNAKKVTYNHFVRVYEATDMTEPIKATVDKEAITKKYAEKRKKLEDDINTLEKTYNAFKIDKNDQKLTAQREAKMKELETVITQLAGREQIKRINEQVEKTRERGKEIVANISEYSTLVDTLQLINRTVIEDAANRINAMFQITHWETTMQMKNGNYKDICKPTVNGISASLNTATRINVGIDICVAISRYMGIQVPLFLDSRESVNKIVQVDSQLINLCVAPSGTPLTITKQ